MCKDIFARRKVWKRDPNLAKKNGALVAAYVPLCLSSVACMVGLELVGAMDLLRLFHSLPFPKNPFSHVEG